ncbi:MAG: ribosome silencing factor [Pseudomonadota bacterium]
MQTPVDVKALVLEALSDRKARDIVALDVTEITTIADHMILGSGTSDRHVKSIAEHVVQILRDHGVKAGGVEGADLGEWVLVDIGDVIVHVMQPRVREFYNLEKLWGINEELQAVIEH